MKRQKKKTELALYVEKIMRLHPDRFPTKRAVAQAIGVNESALSRAQDDGVGLTVEQCLWLAIAVRTDLPRVLRLVKRDKLADAVARAFAATDDKLDLYESEHMAKWRQLKETERTGLTVVIDSLVAAHVARSSVQSAQLKRLAKKLDRDDRLAATVTTTTSRTLAAPMPEPL